MSHHKHLICVTDTESDGPIMGNNSMRSYASVIVDPYAGKIVGEFTDNLTPLPDANEAPKTVNWFKTKYPKAWEALQESPQDPEESMNRYLNWLESFDASLWFAAAPTSYDKGSILYYLRRFQENRLDPITSSPFPVGDFEVNSWKAGLLGVPRFALGETKQPDAWESPLPHPHIALPDAQKEADEILRILNWCRQTGRWNGLT